MLQQKELERTVRDAMIFLKKFNWLHNVQLTKIFDGTLHKIPLEWLPCLSRLNTQELNNLPFNGESSAQMHPDWPSSLHEFLNEAFQLSIQRDQVEIQPASVDINMARGMNKKKLHEVSYMASLVHEVATEACCDVIVDVGSGLGYLDHVLHQVHGHSVLGLETVDSHVSGAESRAAIQGLKSGGVKSVKFNVTNDTTCFHEFEALIKSEAASLSCKRKTSMETACQTEPISGKKPGMETTEANCSSPRICLTGLHCCGDLSPAMLALYHHVPSVHAICFVSCCYHKMSYGSGEHSYFPLSHSCKQFYTRLKNESPPLQISPQTLRLGAQETRYRWRDQTDEDHLDHIRHVAFRGLLELADCYESSFKRKLVRKCDFSSFEAFLDSYFLPSYFTEADISSGKSALRDLYIKHEDDFHLIEVFTALQTVIQPVIESLIYNDRMLWLMEQGHTNIKIVPVFNEIVSPRNLAISVVK